MRRPRPAAATAFAAGLLAGALALGSVPARANGWPTMDVLTHFFIQQLQKAAETAIKNVESAVSNIGSNIVNRIMNLDTSLSDVLSRGFTQLSNYQKAQVGAQQQIADAQNASMAIHRRDERNAEIRDEHVVNPSMCAALDGGVAAAAAGVGGYGVLASIAAVMDARGAAGPGMPSHHGAAQGSASAARLHLGLYCNAMDAEAGLCAAPGPNADANQRATSLWSGGTYADQAAIDAAKDYQTLLIQPVAPAALRGDALASAAGQEAAVGRRSYNARMSLAHHYVAGVVARQAPSVDVSPEQARVMAALGLPPQAQASWLQLLQVEAERRLSDVSWAAYLAAAPPATVQREIAQQQALTNALLFHILKDGLMRGTIAAASLAEVVDRTFAPGVRLPVADLR